MDKISDNKTLAAVQSRKMAGEGQENQHTVTAEASGRQTNRANAMGKRQLAKSEGTRSAQEAQKEASDLPFLHDSPLRVAEEIEHLSEIEDDFENPMSLAALANSLSR